MCFRSCAADRSHPSAARASPHPHSLTSEDRNAKGSPRCPTPRALIAYYPAVLGLTAHALFWGTGLAVLAMPRPWTRYWPILAAPAGLALQSLTVWIGAYAGLPGTNSYAFWTELLPIVLAGLALRKRGAGDLGRDIARLSGLWLAM